jgi:hypothetical protein
MQYKASRVSVGGEWIEQICVALCENSERLCLSSTGKKKEEEELKIHEEDEDLFESMLGDWDGDDDFKKDSEGKPTNFQKGDAHEGVDGIGSMSAAGIVLTLPSPS